MNGKNEQKGNRFVVDTLSGFNIEGLSIGGQETSIIFPQLKLCFDSGRCTQRCVYADTMCLTHTHMDHIGGLGMYIASRNLLSLPPPTILVPESKIEAISNFIDALRVLDDSDLPHEMIPFAPSAETCYSMKNKNYKIKAFETVHPIASQGYVILSTKQKLKDEYLSLKGSEIKALKDDGVEITDTVTVPEIMFTGDTTMDFLHSSPQEVIQEGLKSRLVCLECTFVNDDVSPADAKRFGHTHVRDIAENADRFRECENILLIHFSARYTREEIREGLRNQLAESHAWLYAKITPMLAGYD